MKVLVTSRSGAGKSSLSRELQTRHMIAYDADIVPGLAYWYSLNDHQNLGKIFPTDYNPDAYDWRWDKATLVDLLHVDTDVIVCGSADNAAEFYSLFDRLYILTVEPQEQRRRMTARGDKGYGGDDAVIQERVVAEQAQLEAAAGRIGAIILDSNIPITKVADNLLADLYE